VEKVELVSVDYGFQNDGDVLSCEVWLLERETFEQGHFPGFEMHHQHDTFYLPAAVEQQD
jgi:hypothetical protein